MCPRTHPFLWPSSPLADVGRKQVLSHAHHFGVTCSRSILPPSHQLLLPPSPPPSRRSPPPRPHASPLPPATLRTSMAWSRAHPSTTMPWWPLAVWMTRVPGEKGGASEDGPTRMVVACRARRMVVGTREKRLRRKTQEGGRSGARISRPGARNGAFAHAHSCAAAARCDICA